MTLYIHHDYSLAEFRIPRSSPKAPRLVAEVMPDVDATLVLPEMISLFAEFSVQTWLKLSLPGSLVIWGPDCVSSLHVPYCDGSFSSLLLGPSENNADGYLSLVAPQGISTPCLLSPNSCGVSFAVTSQADQWASAGWARVRSRLELGSASVGNVSSVGRDCVSS